VRKALLLLVLFMGLVAAGCGGSSDDESASTQTEAQTEATGTAECTDAEIPPARDDGGATEPKERLDPEKTYDLVVKTNCGTFTITLDQAGAPATAASLVSLARAGFYDDTIFHRIVPGFVIQGGDPTQTGAGGPGYSTVDVPAADTTYTEGVVAMAKAGNEAPGTSGSQFFVVTGPDAATLSPDFAVVGKVTNGMAVADLIGTFGDAQDPAGTPTRAVVIESVTVEEQ
jgi:peptidyl-prolyl cis-trans isomerase B (cyclophilin B)